MKTTEDLHNAIFLITKANNLLAQARDLLE